jgi:hypothetical protein
MRPFADPTGERVYAPVEGGFVRSSDRHSEQGRPILWPRPAGRGDCIICLESEDRRHVVGIGWNGPPQHFLNNSALSCVHTEPAIGPLGPGDEEEVRGAFYCIEGTKDDLLQRYRADWRQPA